MKPSLALFLGLSLVVASGCGKGEPRSFELAATALQAFPGDGLSPRPGDQDLSEEVEVVSIHQDFLGIPWRSFRDHEPLPLAWEASIDGLVHSAGRMPVFLSLALVGGEGRAYLEADVAPAGVSRIPEWSALCFDFGRDPDAERLKQAYINYALYMIERFQPRWLNLGIELNRYRESCDERTWAALARAESAIYQALKVRHPELPIFPSLELELLHDPDPATLEANLQALELLEMDRLALAIYPFDRDGVSEPARIPDDHLSGITARVALPLIVAETGWPAEELRYAQDQTTGPCVSHLLSSPGQQAEYLRWLVAEADAHDTELLTWWSSRDLLLSGLTGACSTIDREYDCAGHPEWCELVVQARGPGRAPEGELELKSRGALGLRDYQGQAREPMASAWSELRERPLERP